MHYADLQRLAGQYLSDCKRGQDIIGMSIDDMETIQDIVENHPECAQLNTQMHRAIHYTPSVSPNDSPANRAREGWF